MFGAVSFKKRYLPTAPTLHPFYEIIIKRIYYKVNHLYWCYLSKSQPHLMPYDISVRGFIDGTKIESATNRYTFVWKKAVTKNQTKLFAKIAELIVL